MVQLTLIDEPLDLQFNFLVVLGTPSESNDRKELHEGLDFVIGIGPLAIEQLARLKYIPMVIDECMRLHPPFWFEGESSRPVAQLRRRCRNDS